VALAGAAADAAGAEDSDGEAAVLEQETAATSASSGTADRYLIAQGTITSCDASAENGVNVAFLPNLSVAVTV
jgi:hypothetical protein